MRVRRGRERDGPGRYLQELLVADAIGRQPQRRGEQLMWVIIPTERVAAANAARVEGATNPQGAAALRDSARIPAPIDGETCKIAKEIWRRRLEVLQTSALPLGDGAD